MKENREEKTRANPWKRSSSGKAGIGNVPTKARGFEENPRKTRYTPGLVETAEDYFERRLKEAEAETPNFYNTFFGRWNNTAEILQGLEQKEDENAA